MERLLRHRSAVPATAFACTHRWPLPCSLAHRPRTTLVVHTASVDGPELPLDTQPSPSNVIDPSAVTAPAPEPDPSQAHPDAPEPAKHQTSEASTSYSTSGRGSGAHRAFPGRGNSRGRGRGRGNQPPSSNTDGGRRPWSETYPRQYAVPPAPPVYASALTGQFVSTARIPRPLAERPLFLAHYPVPPGKTFNVNSFLGKREPLGGQYLVPQDRYREFLLSYHEALTAGVQMFLTENYQQQVFKYFVELDWEWDTDLAVVMEVTPPLLDLIAKVAGEFYNFPFPNMITSIRTPYKVHVNFPQLLTTELLACLCRDKILEACKQAFPQHSNIDWERLVDFPHGSLRLMGSRKAPVMDRDPEWVREKAYHPARLTNGKWRPGKLTAELLGAASIFPPTRQAAAFERTPAYVDMIFSDLAAYQEKMEERRRRRMAERSEPAQNQPVARPHLPPGSGKNPLIVTLQVNPDETVSLNLYIKSKFRSRSNQAFRDSMATAAATEPGANQFERPGAEPQQAEARTAKPSGGALAVVAEGGRGDDQGAGDEGVRPADEAEVVAVVAAAVAPEAAVVAGPAGKLGKDGEAVVPELGPEEVEVGLGVTPAEVPAEIPAEGVAIGAGASRRLAVSGGQ